MKVGLIGRTHILIKTAHKLVEQGHSISFVYTCKSENFYKAKEKEFENLANDLGVPFFCDTRIEENIQELVKLEADIAVSMNWLTVLKSKPLSAFPYGILNAHAGDLPLYKGNACPNWAILNFEKRIGLTIHKMTENLDSGPYLLKSYFDIDHTTYITDIYEWLETAIPSLFVRSMEVLETTGFIEQSEGQRAIRTFPRRPEDSRIDWKDTTKNILAMIRASSHPFEGAFTYLEGTAKVCIFQAKEHVPDYEFFAIPGQVCFRKSGNPVISSSDGMIEIEECFLNNESNDYTKERICSSLRNRLG